MLQPHLELIGYTDDLHNKSAPPLLFVHGAWHGAWCWDKHFLPYFSQNGYRSYALSLSGHGQSYKPQPFWQTGIAQYIKDVETIIGQLPQPAIRPALRDASASIGSAPTAARCSLSTRSRVTASWLRIMVGAISGQWMRQRGARCGWLMVVYLKTHIR